MSKKAVQAYLETALWSSTGDDDEPLDNEYSIADFSKSALRQAKLEVEIFLAQTEESVSVFEDMAEENGVQLNFDDTDIGHDFWLTRNGHGAGFWDKPEKYGGRLAEMLSDMARRAGETDVYVGDDDLLYFS